MRDVRRAVVKDPAIVKGVFTIADFAEMQTTLRGLERTVANFDAPLGRYLTHQNRLPYLADLSEQLLPLARATFDSRTLVPSYALFSHYEKTARLERHRDTNACTYTLDLCVYQREPWDLWVEGRPYRLEENEALAYYGNAQEHSREAFPSPETNEVAMLFFHFVEPGHWHLTRGPRYWDYAIVPLDNARHAVTDPEHRFFLDAVLNAHRSSEVYAAVERAFPDDDPFERVFGWVEQLSNLDAPGLLIARHLAKGRAPARIATEIGKHGIRMTRKEVAHVCTALHVSCLAMLFPQVRSVRSPGTSRRVRTALSIE